MTTPQVSLCKNCGTALAGPVCHQCGQHHTVQRWTAAVVFKQLANHATNLDRGFLHTAVALFRHPGTVVRDYWAGKTVDYYDPARHLIVWLAISLLLNFWLGVDDILRDSLQPAALEEAVGKERLEDADRRFDSWINLFVLLLVPANSLVTRWLFRTAEKNYGEHLIFNSYSLGQQSIIGCFTQTALYLLPTLAAVYLGTSFVVGWAYNCVIMRQSFGQGWWPSILKAFVVSLAGLLLFGLLVVVFSMLALAVT